jgi:hypothetical protein
MPENLRPLKPLREFNYQLVAAKLDGLYLNVTRDLERQIELGAVRGHSQHVRSLSVLLVMLRFAWNSYGAVRYITADTPHDLNRKPNYVIVVPPINRQLLDLLFSLVYMLDDLMMRSLAYQRAGWRDLVEERATIRAEYGGNVEWEGFLQSMDEQINHMVDIFQITPEEQADPVLVNYWGTPFKLTKRESNCRPFLQFLERSIYKDVSAQAHLTFAGMQKVSCFLVSDLLSESVSEEKRKRAMQSLHFQQVSRTAILFLAITTEIDTYLKLGNHSSIDYLWVIFSEYVQEAREMYEVRYRGRVRG